jgi:hypothetical protein
MMIKFKPRMEMISTIGEEKGGVSGRLDVFWNEIGRPK